MKCLLLAALSLVLVVEAAAAAPLRSQTCPPAGYSRARLEALKGANWTIESDAERNALARAMTACLASPDPAYRDGLGFESLQHWMRANELDRDTLMAIGDDVQARLTAPEGKGFERPFSALVLAEFARTDRIDPWLTPSRRAALLDAALAYLPGVRDYRGFDDRDGWRHGVAHGADLLLQLSLNPAFGKPELTRIRDALATQIAPVGHFYIYGESERLAAPIVYMAQRNFFTEAEWTLWLEQIASPAPLASWGAAFSKNADIARARNVKAFVTTIYAYANLTANGDDDALIAGAQAALQSLP